MQNIPSGSTHYLPKPNGEVQMFYKLGSHTFPDGETRVTLAYFSPDFETWRGSGERNIEEFVKTRLVPISS